MPSLADFGSAKVQATHAGQATTRGGGTEGWQSPEVMVDEGATTASDIFSLGLLFFFVLTEGKHHPFGELGAKRTRAMMRFATTDLDDAEEASVCPVSSYNSSYLDLRLMSQSLQRPAVVILAFVCTHITLTLSDLAIRVLLSRYCGGQVEEANAKVRKRVATAMSESGQEGGHEDAELISAMLRLTPKHRPSAEEVLGSESLHVREKTVAGAAGGERAEEQLPECVVCLDDEPTHAVLPCGHRCLCAGCLVAAARECPVCRTPSQGTVRIFVE